MSIPFDDNIDLQSTAKVINVPTPINIGDATPKFYVDASSTTVPYLAIITTYLVQSTDGTIDCTGTFTVTLLTAVGRVGKIFNIKNSDTGIITIATTSSQTVDGGTTAIIKKQYDSLMLQSTGANWIII